MRKTQIVKMLNEAGITSNYQLNSNKEIEIYVEDDYDATEKLSDKIGSILHWGGFRMGSGAWLLREGYRSSGDWTDKSSEWHY